jgi:NitT/TauT family transport system substrate-binding protein
MTPSKFALVAALAFAATASADAQTTTIPITIGHQSMCTDTYTAGIVV